VGTILAAGKNAPKALGASATEPLFSEDLMDDSGPRLDKDASRAIKRIELQMQVEGKFHKADLAQEAGNVAFILAILVAAVFLKVLQVCGVSGTVGVVLGVPIFLGVFLLVFSQTFRA
jgi:hypothetical protein